MKAQKTPHMPKLPYVNAAYNGAFVRGWWDRLASPPRAVNPYRDVHSKSGRVTFSRGFRLAWSDGYRRAHAALGRLRQPGAPREADPAKKPGARKKATGKKPGARKKAKPTPRRMGMIR